MNDSKISDDDDQRPLASFIVLAFEQERYIREAVNGAFAQTYTPMEIILSDDCSTDETYAIIEEMALEYQGPHRIILNRNKENIGLAKHVNNCIGLSSGEILLLAAGDDISIPKRTSLMCGALIASKHTMGVFSNIDYIDSQGTYMGTGGKNLFRPTTYTLQEFLQRSDSCPLVGCSSAFRKRVFEVFGPLSGNVMAEDNAIRFRVLLLGGQQYITDILVHYRFHDNNLSRIMGRQYKTWQEFCTHSSYLVKNISGLLRQHAHDADMALRLGLVGEKERTAIDRWLDAENNRASRQHRFINSKHRLIFYLRHILIGGDISIRKKCENAFIVFGMPGVRCLIWLQKIIKRLRM